jgi:DNA repair protein RecO (recombination protein O)
MLASTQAIVLRSIKYGETSLVVTMFTRVFGVQAYLVQGIRVASAKGRSSRAGLLQPATLLDVVAYRLPGQHLQRLREFTPAHLYTSLQSEVVKNSIALFSVELLLRLIPQEAEHPELFDLAFEYFQKLDAFPANAVANFPLYFIIMCSRALGYELAGEYSQGTPNLNLREGGFTADAPVVRPFVADEEAAAIARVLAVQRMEDLAAIEMNAGMRFRLIDWYLEFLHQHTQHLGQIKSLGVLRTILH